MLEAVLILIKAVRNRVTTFGVAKPKWDWVLLSGFDGAVVQWSN